MLNLKPTVAALGLYGEALSHPGGEAFERFFSMATDIAEGAGTTFTHIAAEGSGYTGDYTLLSGKTRSRLLKTAFSGVSVLSLTSCSADSDAPSFDGFLTASMTYMPSVGELIVVFVVNEGVISLQSPRFEVVLDNFSILFPWFGGFALSDRVERHPELFLLGMDSGKLSSKEYEGLCAWYSGSVEEHKSRLRDVFTYNILSEALLSRRIASGETLREFVLGNDRWSLRPLGNAALFVWRIPEDDVALARKALDASGLIF